MAKLTSSSSSSSFFSKLNSQTCESGKVSSFERDGWFSLAGCWSELLQRHDPGAAAEDLRPLLRVPADAQRRGAGPSAAGQVAGSVLRRDQPAGHGQVQHAESHLFPQTGALRLQVDVDAPAAGRAFDFLCFGRWWNMEASIALQTRPG